MLADLLPTEDQSMIRDSVEGLLESALPLARLRDPTNHAGAAERRAWRRLADAGLFGMGLPVERGGVGYGLPEEVVVARELGRRLTSPCVAATMLAAHLAPTGSELSRALIAGEARAAFANILDGELDGEVCEADLIDAEGAAVLVLWADGRALLAPPPDDEGRTLIPMDETVSLRRAQVRLADAISADPAVATRADLLVCGHLVGIAEAARDMAVDYAATRIQFGQPIGSFQAVKHACADMAMRAEAAAAQTFYATLLFEARAEDPAADVASARLIAGKAALDNAKANIQVHGAMGFTQECDAHLYLKRAQLFSALNGSRARQLAQLAP